MLVSGLSADHHDEYFSIIMSVILQDFIWSTSLYFQDAHLLSLHCKLWQRPNMARSIDNWIFSCGKSNICRFTNLMVCVRIFLLAWVGVQRKKIRFSLERICVVLKSERLFIISEINLTFPCFPQLVAGNIWFWSIWMPDFNVKENTVLISTLSIN